MNAEEILNRHYGPGVLAAVRTTVPDISPELLLEILRAAVPALQQDNVPGFLMKKEN